MSSSGTQEFGRVRAVFWPVHRHELAMLVPMLLMFFFVTFNYNILRVMKDSLIVPAAGAAAIPFIKVWVMFPGSLLLTFIFTRLSNRFSRDTVFYSMLSIFLGYFLLFIFLIYPARDYLHPHAAADILQANLSEGFRGFIAMFRYWTFTSFYVMSELWSNIILSMLFWGFANQITQVSQAKRFYGLFGVGVNISGVAAGFFGMAVSSYFGGDHWQGQMTAQILTITLAGLGTMALYHWITTRVLADQEVSAVKEENQEVRGKMSMRENIAALFKSRYLLYIAAIVISYNLVINLVEVLWKDALVGLYPDNSDYNYYMNKLMASIGIMATVISYLVSGNAIRLFGWTVTAMSTPLILFVTSLGFFFFLFVQNSQFGYEALFGAISPLALVVFFGSAQNFLSRVAKYTVFDATKEMAFVPLSQESKIKGKAAIDGICNRLGKAGGSVIHFSLLITMGSFIASAPYVCALLMGAIAIWMYAVKKVGNQFSIMSGDVKQSFEGERPALVNGMLKEQQQAV